MRRRLIFLLCIFLSFLVAATASADITSNLEVHLKFDGDTVDATGNGYYATQYGGLSFGDGVFGQSLVLDGVDGHAIIENATSLFPGYGDFSFSVWVRYNDTGVDLNNQGKIFLLLGDSQNNFIQSERGTDNAIGMSMKSYGQPWTNTNAPGSIEYLSMGDWHHLAGTRIGSTLRLYADGVLIEETDSGANANIVDTNGKLWIGVRPQVPQKYIAANLDELRIYHRGLTAVDISELYALRNNAPIANAGPDQTAHVGELVTLDGSNSDDIDEDYPLVYDWSVYSAPAESVAIITNADQALASFTPDITTEDFVLELVVTDALGAVSEPDYVTISATNSAPVANAGPDQIVIVVGSIIQLDGSQSDDPDEDDLTYHWTVAGPGGSIQELTTVDPSFAAGVNGNYNVTLVVNDGWVDSDPDTMVVSFDNVAPVADAGVDQSAVLGETVYLSGTGSDANLDPLTFGWAVVAEEPDSNPVLGNANQASATFDTDKAGEYVLNLIVDDGQLYSEASSITIVIIPQEEAITTLIQDTMLILEGMDQDNFLKKKSKKKMTKKLNNAIKLTTKGKYTKADKVLSKVLRRVDGCALRGGVDTLKKKVSGFHRDWITNCPAQVGVYSNIIQAQNYLDTLQ